MRFPRTMLTAAVALTIIVTGCSNNDSKSTVDASKPYNDADVTFATQMIQHHAQALQMVDLTLGRQLDPKVAALAEDIRLAQGPEIEQMVSLLDGWDHQPIPATGRDHVNADDLGSKRVNTSMPGMMTADELKALAAAQGPEFQTRWLELMIEHHLGAMKMASTEAEKGEDKTATALADDIVGSQGVQVKTMQGLLQR